MLFFKIKDHEELLSKHLTDVRKHLLFSISYATIIFLTVFYYSKTIYGWLTAPLLKTLSKYQATASFIITSLPEGFITYVKMAFFTSLFITIPILLWQIAFYLLPIFNQKNHQKTLIIVVVLAPLLFYLGVFFAYYFSFYVIFSFFVKFAITKQLGLYLKVSEYISLALSIMVWLGICFQLPIIIFVMYKLGLVEYQNLKKIRKFAILIAFVIAAIITPPDPFSQIIMALILIFLYELSIFMIKLSK